MCPNADNVVTRLFFVYANTSVMENGMSTTDQTFHQEIMHAVQMGSKIKQAMC